VEIVRAGLEAWNAGDMDALRETYDPGTIFRTPEGWPEPGPYVGREAVMRQLEQLRETCVYSFVLFAPPVPLAQLEGVLDDQVEILQEELKSLRQILERN